MRATHCGIVVAAALNFLRMCNDSDYLSGQKMWLTPVFYLPVGLGPSTRSAFFLALTIPQHPLLGIAASSSLAER
jgi:hypothetical protein